MQAGRNGRLSDSLRNRLERVRLLLLDVDGVLTDGGLFYGEDGSEWKRFDVKDGAGIFLARRAGLEVGILTGKTSRMVERRAGDLGMTRVLQGALDKGEGLEAILADGKYAPGDVGYVGDDVLDLPAMRRVAFAACPADAHPAVAESAHYVCERRGGHGAVREVIDLILEARGGWASVEALLREDPDHV